MKTKIVNILFGFGALLYGGAMLNVAYRGSHGKVMLPVMCLFLGLLVWFFQRARQLSLTVSAELQKNIGSFISYSFVLILVAFLLGVAASGGFFGPHANVVARIGH